MIDLWVTYLLPWTCFNKSTWNVPFHFHILWKFPKDFVLVSEKMKDVLFPPSLDLLCMIKWIIHGNEANRFECALWMKNTQSVFSIYYWDTKICVICPIVCLIYWHEEHSNTSNWDFNSRRLLGLECFWLFIIHY